MRTIVRVVVTLGCSILAWSSPPLAEAAQSAAPAGFTSIVPQAIAWKPHPTVPNGQMAVLLGDPTKPAHLVLRVRFPPHTRIAPHTHPDARTYTVLAGEWKLGFGDRFDESQLQAFPVGSLYRLPANVPHFQATGAEGTIVQIESIGPTRTDPVKQDAPKKD